MVVHRAWLRTHRAYPTDILVPSDRPCACKICTPHCTAERRPHDVQCLKQTVTSERCDRMSRETPPPWAAVPRHGDWDKDEMSGLGWNIEGPPEPLLGGQFALAADAHKAAAAPESYEALKAWVSERNFDRVATYLRTPSENLALAAIAKAEGREA